jgi:glycosyltransferase involved in cell wall biosynthesis
MRVLHISAGNLYGGVETLLVTLARFRHLCPSMEPEFAICFEGKLARELKKTDVSVHRLGGVRVRNPFSVRRTRQKLAQLLHSKRFDAAICHMPWALAVFGSAIRSADVPLLYWQHGVTAGRHWLERWARLTPPDLAICNSHFTANTLEHFLPGVHNEVIYCPVPPQATPFTEADRLELCTELGTAPEATIIIQVGRMEPLKGHALLLRALSQLRDRGEWACWIVGGAQRRSEAEYLEQIRATARTLGIDNRVVFLGQRDDVARLLSAADLFCQPNVGPEGFGIVFVEALYSGSPVVTTALGGAAEIVDASCGVLVAPGDVSAVAAALEGLILDPALRRMLASRGPRRANALCAPEIQIRRLYETLEKVADNRIGQSYDESRIAVPDSLEGPPPAPREMSLRKGLADA